MLFVSCMPGDPVYAIRVTDSYCWDIQCKGMLMPSPPAICLFSVLIDPAICVKMSCVYTYGNVYCIAGERGAGASTLKGHIYESPSLEGLVINSC